MKKFFTLIALAVLCSASAMAYDTWSVVGNHAIMNGTSDWAIAETANDLTTTDGTTYTLTVTEKTLEVGTTYEYKFAKDHAWTTSIPQDGNNSLTVSANGIYTIVYTVNVSTGDYSAEATKTGDAGEVTHTYSIAGSSTELFGASWSETSTTTEMTKGDDGIYTWSASNVTLSAGDIEYKVVVDHAWGTSYPSNNAKLTISGDGDYDVTITFNPTSKEVTGTATAKGDVTVKYYLKSDWQDGVDAWTWREMTKQDDGTYTLDTQYTSAGCNYDVTDTGSGSWMELSGITVEEGLTKGDACTYILTPGESVAISVKKTAATLTISDAGYATYYDSKHAYTMPEGVTGEIAQVAYGEVTLTDVYKAGKTVPADEPLVLVGEAGTYSLKYTTSSTSVTYKSAGMNDLDGTDIATALTADDSSYFYALSLNAAGEANSVGFYWMNETGAAFTNGAHKAYLKLAKSAGSKSAYLFNDEATAINAISTEANVNAPAYNLAGQRVNANAKGIVIMNGHKYINK